MSGQRARYETDCMERFLRLKAKKMSSKFVRLKWEYFYCVVYCLNENLETALRDGDKNDVWKVPYWQARQSSKQFNIANYSE